MVFALLGSHVFIIVNRVHILEAWNLAVHLVFRSIVSGLSHKMI